MEKRQVKSGQPTRKREAEDVAVSKPPEPDTAVVQAAPDVPTPGVPVVADYPNGKSPTFGDGVALLAPSLVLCAAIVVTVGFVVTGAHLARYGVNDVALLKPRYLGAGTLYLVLTAFTIGCCIDFFLKCIECFDIPSSHPDVVSQIMSPRVRQYALTALSLVSSTVMIWEVLGGASRSNMYSAPWDRQLGASGPYIWYATALFTAYGWHGIFINRKTWPRQKVLWSDIRIPLVFLIGNTASFALMVYPLVPPMLGGGAVATVRLVPDASSAADLRVIVPFDATTKTTVPVQLLDETDRSLIILVREPAQDKANTHYTYHAARVDRQWIKGIIYGSVSER